MNNTFTLDELRNVLIQHGAFIAHCAGFAKGVGNAETAQYSYLARLQVAAKSNFELSCSTIKLGDYYTFGPANYSGKVGLILSPKHADSITFASCVDGGTQIDPTRPGRRAYTGKSLSITDIESAIKDRPAGEYNELCIVDYDVAGVFYDEPIQYAVEDGIGNLLPADVVAAFDSQNVYRLYQGQLYRIPGSSMTGPPVPVSELL